MAPKKASKSATAIAKTTTTAAAMRKASKSTSSSEAQVSKLPSSSATLDSSLVRKAVAALFTYEAKKHESSAPVLIEDYAKPVIAQIQLIKAVAKPVIRPVRVAIPHSMFLPESQGHSVCFFCRSDDHDALEGYFRTHPFNGLVKIISITQVRKSYNTYKDRKALLKDHTHFVCDARVMTQLYNLLGKVFAERNNLPVPIEFETFSKIPAALQKSLDSSYMHLKGGNISIHLGNSLMNPTDVAENVFNGLEFAVGKLRDQWSNVQNIHLKTSSSPALPIYAKASSEVVAFVKSHSGRSNDDETEEQSSGKTSKTSKHGTSSADTSTKKGGLTQKVTKLGVAPKSTSKRGK